MPVEMNVTATPLRPEPQDGSDDRLAPAVWHGTKQKLGRLLLGARRLSPWFRYGAGTMLVVSALGLQAWLSEFLPGHPFLVFSFAILLSAVLFDWDGGLWALTLSALAADYCCIEPLHSLAIANLKHGLALAVFVAIGLGTVLIVHALNNALDRIAEAHAEVAAMLVRLAASERQKDLLVHELNHRVKNTLATVQSIARRSLRNAPSLAAFEAGFEERLSALAKTHDLLTLGGWVGTPLRDVIEVELQPYSDGCAPRWRLRGPDVMLNPREVLTLGMVFHELATNAAKYGALSGRGEIEVVWEVGGPDASPALGICWRESGGPPLRPPTRRGFGSQLIAYSLQALGGDAAQSFPAEGFRCGLSLPYGPGRTGQPPSERVTDAVLP